MSNPIFVALVPATMHADHDDSHGHGHDDSHGHGHDDSHGHGHDD